MLLVSSPAAVLWACLAAAALPTAFAAAADTPPPTETAVACLAEAVYFEAKGTTDKGAQAVANVVVNRRASEEFPDTVCEVVGDGCQFSYQCDGKPEALAIPEERERAVRTAKDVLSGEAADITDGALFFHANKIDPGWFATRPRIGEFGDNIFYR